MPRTAVTKPRSMISKDCLSHLKCLAGGIGNVKCSNGPRRRAARSMATVADPPPHLLDPRRETTFTATPDLDTHVTTTIYQFPTMEPLSFAYYPHNHLYLPLRQDILHKAVIYEGDKTRQGTASTKWRDEVHGSHHKVHPQKGLGKARVGDKQSPIRRGGGVAFGPKPRDFSTDLPNKMYDLAWRTALSYRYRRGQLVVVDKIKDLQHSNEMADEVLVKQMFTSTGLKSSMLVAASLDDCQQMWKVLLRMKKSGSTPPVRLLDTNQVDVKNLLEARQLVIEKDALDRIFRQHVRDLGRRIPFVPGELPPVEGSLAA